MKNKISTVWGFAFLFGAFCTSAWADVVLKDKSEIVGKWVLESVAPGIDKPKVEENRTWEFRADGVLVSSGYNRHLKQDDTKEFKYQVVDGKIKAEDPGRPGKPLDYVVHEMTGNTLVLKGGIEGAYFLKKK